MGARGAEGRLKIMVEIKLSCLVLGNHATVFTLRTKSGSERKIEQKKRAASALFLCK